MDEEVALPQPDDRHARGNRIFGYGMPNLIIGPSTIHIFSATGFRRLNGG